MAKRRGCAVADILNFPAKMPGKTAPQNEGVSGDRSMNVAVLPPFGAFGHVGRYSGLHPDGYRISVWLVQPLNSPSNALLTPGTPL